MARIQTYSREGMKNIISRLLDDPSIRMIEADLYMEIVDDRHDVHGRRETLRFVQEPEEPC